MNARAAPALPAPLAELRQRAVAAWSALAPRERRIVGAAAALLALALVWLAAVAPAWRTLRELPPQIARAEAELQQMQALAAESKTLRAATPVAPAQAAAALRSATARLGEQVRVVQQGDRYKLSLSGVDGAALRNLLTEVRAGARMRPLEAQIVRGAKGFDGSLVLGLGGAD